MENLLLGLQELCSLQIILFIIIGAVVGIIAGAIPGLNDTNILTLFLSFVIFMDPFPAVILMTAVFISCQTAADTKRYGRASSRLLIRFILIWVYNRCYISPNLCTYTWTLCSPFWSARDVYACLIRHDRSCVSYRKFITQRAAFCHPWPASWNYRGRLFYRRHAFYFWCTRTVQRCSADTSSARPIWRGGAILNYF